MPNINITEEEEALFTEGNGSYPIKDTERRIKARYVLAILGFLGVANVYAMRVNLSVAIVAMVNSTVASSKRNVASSLLTFSPSLLSAFSMPVSEDSVNGSLLSDVCPVKTETTFVENFYAVDADDEGEFSWDESTQGIVLGSFFYGYVATQIPGGRIAELMGGRHVFGLGVLFTGIFTLLSPPVARFSKEWGIGPFVFLRVLEGLSEGVTFPSMMAMMAKWVPPLERSRFSAVVFAGSLFGTIISMPISGLLCGIDLPVYWRFFGPGGWPLAFYIFGALGVIWYIAWMALISDTPSTHPNICLYEKRYIEWSLRQENELLINETNDEQEIRVIDLSAENPTQVSRIPWWKLCTSVPLWAALVTMCGQSWAFYTLLTELPTYMARVLHFNIKQNSFLSALPYLATWICSLPMCWIADWLRSSNYLSNTASLKIFNSISVVLPSLGLVGVAYAGCHSNLILTLLVLNGAFVGASYAGVQINHLALSPRLAGTIYGITNCISNICGFLAPYATGSIIQGHETLTRWRYVFLISAGVNLLGNLFYVAFASGEVQPWDAPEEDDTMRRRRPSFSSTTAIHSQTTSRSQSVNDDVQGSH